MNDPRGKGPYTILGETFAESVNQRRALPPDKRALARASGGAALLAWCAYTAATFKGILNTFPPLVIWIWIGCVGLGSLWLIVGARKSQGARDVMEVFWSAVIAIGCIALLVISAYPDDAPFLTFMLKGVYLSVLASSSTRFWLTVRGPEGDAQKMVSKRIDDQKIEWRSARRPRR